LRPAPDAARSLSHVAGNLTRRARMDSAGAPRGVRMLKKSRYPIPRARPLQVYAFDPSVGRSLNNYLTIEVPYEKLEPGPVGNRIAVVDYDASNELYYEPIDLDDPAALLNGGLDPSESDPRFHQQMAYAIASKTIERFDLALGRRVRWKTIPGSRRTNPFHRRLRIFPHAFQQANAFYDAKLGAVLFGYFAASRVNPGEAIPGQTIHTCLSHDIIVHEMTHAVIDGQREYLTDATGPDAAAFHEAFADIVALFQHFAFKDVLLDTIYRTGGQIHRVQLESEVTPANGRAAIVPELTKDNPLVGLARQFGFESAQKGGPRAALRSAIGTPPNSKALESISEPHERGAILVSAVFDAYFTAYISRTRDIMRRARVEGTVTPRGDLRPDLAERLAQEASTVAGHFLNMCIRALDYCPPVDLTFGEFLRAIITADSDIEPDDQYDYRGALITAFRLRGIVPQEVVSYAEEALRWGGTDAIDRPSPPPCVGLDYGTRTGGEYAEVRNRTSVNARVLVAYAKANAASLGLDPDPETPPQAHGFHPVYRVKPSGKLEVSFVAELLQQRKVPLDPSAQESPLLTFRGGSTVIFDDRGEVRYVIRKNINNRNRLAKQQGFSLESLDTAAAAPYVGLHGVQSQINFQLVHEGV
jgi:hypothetical protein